MAIQPRFVLGFSLMEHILFSGITGFVGRTTHLTVHIFTVIAPRKEDLHPMRTQPNPHSRVHSQLQRVSTTPNDTVVCHHLLHHPVHLIVDSTMRCAVR